MKRKISIILVLCMLMAVPALAQADRINDRLFDQAKQILRALDTGDYASAASLIPGCSSDMMEKFASGSFSSLGYGSAQTRVSVAFYVNGAWYLAVPVQTPDSDSVETLIMNCGDGTGFTAYGEVSWSAVSSQLEQAEAVLWNEEYLDSVAVIDG